jgi:hypothetical protein
MITPANHSDGYEDFDIQCAYAAVHAQIAQAYAAIHQANMTEALVNATERGK